jgi:peptidyl-tRNA hydrolase
MMIIVYDDVRMDVNRIRLKMPYLADNNSKLLALKTSLPEASYSRQFGFWFRQPCLPTS